MSISYGYAADVTNTRYAVGKRCVAATAAIGDSGKTVTIPVRAQGRGGKLVLRPDRGREVRRVRDGLDHRHRARARRG